MARADVIAVELQRVTKAFGGRRVLDEVTLRVRRGQSVCILGRSGTGKSVTLKHIVGLIRPDSGRVLVGDVDVTTLSGRELALIRRQIGFLFQNSALFDSISVGENVAFPLRRHTSHPNDQIRAEATAMLARVGLEREYEKMPADLSGGMRKRAALARALALGPSILLADEPSAGLDPVTATEIDDLLVNLKGQSGTTLIVVTHNIPSARVVGDELVFLHEGKILEQGSAAALDASTHPLVQQFMRAEGSG